MSWTKLPAIKCEIVGCASCSPNREVYPLDRRFIVGFGSSSVTRDDEVVWEESPTRDFEHAPTLGVFEAMALANPDHDWRMRRHAPLRDATYQRHGPGLWVLVREGHGFA